MNKPKPAFAMYYKFITRDRKLISDFLEKTIYKFLTTGPKEKTAGIIVIGDEILKGDVMDTNSNYALKKLHKRGVNVKKVSIIRDDIDEISKEVKELSSKFDYVLTSGGIGPTHDDVTYEGIAKAFELKVKANLYLVNLFKEYYKTDDLNAPGMKLAFIPETAKLIFPDSEEPKAKYPSVSCRNVYIFPGIPELFRKAIDSLGPKLFSSHSKYFCRNVFLNVNERCVVDVLNKLVQEFPDVEFGSYPTMKCDQYQVRISVESTSKKLTSEATNKLLSSFPHIVITEIVSKNNVTF